MRVLIAIDCGEKTCASEPGKFCRFVRAGSFGTEWHCAAYEKRLDTTDGKETGWLARLPECLAGHGGE